MRVALLLIALTGSSVHAATLAADSLVCESLDSLDFIASVFGAGRWMKASVAQNATQSLSKYGGREGQGWRAVAATCAGAGPETVTVLERKSISGYVKVKMTYKGHPAEFWTYSAFVTE
jgi:hypothetical protein